VVHHQSEDFNYTASVRVTVFQSVARGIFWSVLPLIGFPAGMVYILLLIHGTYPFFTHTQLVGKLGWLEYILVTPSHHRVHHSSNQEYLDKNYGDVLIIWDKLFGTFAKEESKPAYGLTTSLQSYSFLWQHFHFLLELAVGFKRSKGWRQKLRIVFGKPDDIDPRIRTYLERKLLSRSSNQHATPALTSFIKVQTVLTLIILFITILFEHYLGTVQLSIAAIFILISAINTGAMLEQKRWVFELDFTRLGLIGMFAYSYYPYAITTAIVLLLLLLVLVFLKECKHFYYSILY
jgi:alkylglycerol monooxygenase